MFLDKITGKLKKYTLIIVTLVLSTNYFQTK